MRKAQSFSSNELHTLAGIFGGMLPIIALAGNYMRCGKLPTSISATYYMFTGDAFVIALGCIGMVFFCNKGYDNKDWWAYKISSLCCFAIALCACEQDTRECCIRYLPVLTWRVTTHYISATILFTMLGLISKYQFTRTSGNYTHEKLQRNKMYNGCGNVILSCVGFMALNALLKLNLPIGIPESIVLESFCLAWMVKGGVFMRDR